jgi:hypothetical protein
MICRERESFLENGYINMTNEDVMEQMEITQEENYFEFKNNFVDFLIDN